MIDMEIIIGAAVGLMVAILGRTLKFDQDASFYPVILIVIAFYYVLFSVLSGETDVVVYELLIALAFTITAIIGSKISIYIVAVGLIFHGIFDVFHNFIFLNDGVPSWWPGFCAAADVVLGMLVIYFAINRSSKALQPTHKARY